MSTNPASVSAALVVRRVASRGAAAGADVTRLRHTVAAVSAQTQARLADGVTSGAEDRLAAGVTLGLGAGVATFDARDAGAAARRRRSRRPRHRRGDGDWR